MSFSERTHPCIVLCGRMVGPLIAVFYPQIYVEAPHVPIQYCVNRQGAIEMFTRAPLARTLCTVDIADLL